MSSTCLSSATIVRCNALSREETTAIFIPPVLQFILSIVLVASRWGSGKRKHYFLVAEGWIYFILTLLDLLAHQINSARDSISTFRVFDIVIGVFSFLPILLYTAFLYILTRSSFIPYIPRRFQKVARYTLMIFIPVTVATNEVGSFVGISYLLLQDIFGNRVLAIGFQGPGDQAVWQFFNSITLAMLLTFQAVVFALSFYHFMKPYLSRSAPGEKEASTKPKPYMFKGVGWVALGVKLGSIESLLGFVDGQYNIIITRRVLRLLSRTCMIVAVLTGLDGFEDFRHTSSSRKKSLHSKSGSNIRGMISNPRNSTFTRLSPSAKTFYGLPRAAANDFSADDLERRARMQQRVTVRFDGAGRMAPTLDVRLSDLNMPSPELLTATFNKRGTLVSGAGAGLKDLDDIGGDEKEALRKLQMRMRADSESRTAGLTTPGAVAQRTFKYSTQGRDAVDLVRSKSTLSRNPSKAIKGRGLPASVRRNNSDGANAVSALRPTSAESSASDTLDVVHRLAQQFPGIPPRVTKYSMDGIVMMGEGYNGTTTRASSFTRPRSDANNANPFADPSLSRQNSGGSAKRLQVVLGDNGKSTTSLNSNGSVKRKAVPVPPPIDATLARPFVQMQATGGTTSTLDSMYVHEFTRRGSDSSVDSAGTIPDRDPFASSSDVDSPGSGLGVIARRVAELERRRAALKIQDDDGARNPFNDSEAAAAAEVSRIKSIGRVSSRQTPTPSSIEFVRQSVVIEQGQVAQGGAAKVVKATRATGGSSRR